MTRKGELTRGRLDREYPHHVALPAEKVRGLANGEQVRGFANALSAAPGLVLVCAIASAHAEKRVALVIGNDSYANLPANEQLQKAVNDARAVGDALKQIGFDVIEGENLSRAEMVEKLDKLVGRLAPGDIAFFFFSGHGLSLNGINYLLPADMPQLDAGQETRMRFTALSETDIVAGITVKGGHAACGCAIDCFLGGWNAADIAGPADSHNGLPRLADYRMG